MDSYFGFKIAQRILIISAVKNLLPLSLAIIIFPLASILLTNFIYCSRFYYLFIGVELILVLICLIKYYELFETMIVDYAPPKPK